MACCDFIVAAEDLRICFPEVRRGLVPALAAAVVRSRVRDGDLRELLLLAEPIDAPRALQHGAGRSSRSRPTGCWPSRKPSPRRSSRAGPRRSAKPIACSRELDSTDRQRLFARH